MAAQWILVVEDEPAVAELLVHVFMSAGYRVQHAANGLQAWDLLCISCPPDLVVTDVVMPEMDGAALMEKMNETPELVQVPVLVLSALDKEEVRRRLPSIESFLSKPFQVGQVMANVDCLLRQQESNSRARRQDHHSP